MEFKNNRATPKKDTGAKNGINLDYDYNTEYGDGDIPNCDKNISELDVKHTSNASRNNSAKNIIPDDVPRRDGPGGE